VAIASDFNPGSCHCDNLLLLASFAAPQYKMNQGELWAAITLNSAHALGLKNQGALLPGLKPRLSFFNTDSIDRITYSWGKNLSTGAN
jgi:imidazolonepropionase